MEPNNSRMHACSLVLDELKNLSTTITNYDGVLDKCRIEMVDHRFVSGECDQYLDANDGTMVRLMNQCTNLHQRIANDINLSQDQEIKVECERLDCQYKLILKKASELYDIRKHLLQPVQPVLDTTVSEEDEVPMSFSPLPVNSHSLPQSSHIPSGLLTTQNMTHPPVNSSFAPITMNFNNLIKFLAFPNIPRAGDAFDNNDIYCFNRLRKDVATGKLQNELSIYTGLRRVLRVKEGTLDFYVKEEGVNGFMTKFYPRNLGEILLKSVKLGFTTGKKTKKEATVLDVYKLFSDEFVVHDVALFSYHPKVFSLFSGYRIPTMPHVLTSPPIPWDDFVREGIANGKTDVYTYINKWIATIKQYPGRKLGTALVLKGVQGAGKNRFTDAICKILEPYSEKNVTKMSELTGRYNGVVAGKTFIVLNEARQMNSSYNAATDAMKSIITDDVIRVNDKYVQAKTTTNTLNIILVTNNSMPVQITTDDRRYVVIRVNPKFKGTPTLTYLYKALNDLQFCTELSTYYQSIDVSDFNPEDIPQTDEKIELTLATLKPIDRWCLKFYTQLTSQTGVPCEFSLKLKPPEYDEDEFKLEMKERCDRIRLRDGDERSYVFLLKHEYAMSLRKLL